MLRIAEGKEEWNMIEGVDEDAAGRALDWLFKSGCGGAVDDDDVDSSSFRKEEVVAGLTLLESTETETVVFENAASPGNSDSQAKEALSQEVSIGWFFLSAR